MAPPAPFPGYINTYLRGGDLRSRLGTSAQCPPPLRGQGRRRHDQAGSNWDFSTRPQDDTSNQYQLLRIMPRVGYNGARVSFLVEAARATPSATSVSQAAAPGQNCRAHGPLDIYQAYLLLPATKTYRCRSNSGARSWVYGDQRLVGHARWLNVRARSTASSSATKRRRRRGRVLHRRGLRAQQCAESLQLAGSVLGVYVSLPSWRRPTSSRPTCSPAMSPAAS